MNAADQRARPVNVAAASLALLLMLSACVQSPSGTAEVPFRLLAPSVSTFMNGNGRGIYLAEVLEVKWKPTRMVGCGQQEGGVFGRIRILEVLSETPPNASETSPQTVQAQAVGAELAVLLALEAPHCRRPDRALAPQDRIIAFLWRAATTNDQEGNLVASAYLDSKPLCLDGDMVHVADWRVQTGVQERGDVPLNQFRQAVSVPWVSGGDGGVLQQRCATGSCPPGQSCFLGAGCWSFERGGPATDRCCSGDYQADGTECAAPVSCGGLD